MSKKSEIPQLMTIDELLKRFNADLAEMPRAHWGKRKSVQDMRDDVTNLLLLNIFYVENDMKPDPVKSLDVHGGARFIEKPVKLFREHGGYYYVGAKYRSAWVAATRACERS